MNNMAEGRSQQASEYDSLPVCVRKFMAYFEEINPEAIDDLNDIYADNILFRDPIHEISGIDSLKAYFKSLNKNLHSGTFEFSTVDLAGNICYLQWIMRLTLKRPMKKIEVKGISILTFEEKITFQQDYFDMGALAYEHIPLIGGIIKGLKKRMSRIDVVQ